MLRYSLSRFVYFYYDAYEIGVVFFVSNTDCFVKKILYNFFSRVSLEMMIGRDGFFLKGHIKHFYVLGSLTKATNKIFNTFQKRGERFISFIQYDMFVMIRIVSI